MTKKTFPCGIALIGFMATGKTTIAKDLSKRLDRELINVDKLIQDKMNMSINEIFSKYGEDYFRKIEKEIIEEIKERKSIVMDCGGGVPLKPENIINIKENNTIILLQASPETILKRLENNGSRPLLKKNMSVEEIGEFLEKRRDSYDNSADIKINTDNKNVEEITNEIMEKILDKGKGRR